MTKTSGNSKDKDDAEHGESGGTRARSAITGKFLKEATAERHPKQTVGKTYKRSSSQE